MPDAAAEADPNDVVEAAILSLVAARGPHKSICPTEAARLLAGTPQDAAWRAWLPAVRRAACRLAAGGRIDVLRHGKPVEPAAIKGVIRLRLRET